MEFGPQGGQVVRKICVVVFALRRSVSFFDATNWNLRVICNANVGADALIGPWYNGTNSPKCSEKREYYPAGR